MGSVVLQGLPQVLFGEGNSALGGCYLLRSRCSVEMFS